MTKETIKKNNTKNTGCELISLIPIVDNFEIELYKIDFPIEIYNAFWDNFKSKNKTDFAYMRIKELHDCIRLDLTDIYYTHFISSKNLDFGWIFSETDTNLPSIKRRLKMWLEIIGLTGFEDTIKKLKFEKISITVTKEDLLSGNYKANIFLSYMAKYLSENLSINLTDNDKNKLSFTLVNNSSSFRLLGLTDSNFVTVGEKQFLYGYYLDFYILHNILTKEIFLNVYVGQLRLVSNPFKTYYGKGFNPYIILNQDNSKGSYKTTAITGKINYSKPKKDSKNDDLNNKSELSNFNKGYYHWDKSLDSILGLSIDELPKPNDILTNPLEYANKDKNISILVPYGTHISTPNVTDSSSGVDYFARELILDEVYNNLYNFEIFSKRPIHKLSTKRSSLDFKNDILNGQNELNIDLLHLNDYTREIFELFENDFNNIQDSLNRLDLIKSKEFDGTVDNHEKARLSAVELLYKSIYPKSSHLNKNLQIKFNYIDYSHTKAINTPKESNSIEFLKNEFPTLSFNKEASTSIIEYEEADYFVFNKKKDFFNGIRKHNALMNNKTTQFVTPFKECKNKKEESEHYNLIYGKIVNCILESIRQLGFVSPKDLDKIPTNIGVIEHLGYFIFVAINGDKVYGKVNDSEWLNYHNFLLHLSKITKKGDISSLDNNIIEASVEELIRMDNTIEDITLSLHYPSLKKYMSYFMNNCEGNFNLKLYKKNTSNNYLKYSKSNVSVLAIDESNNIEWVPVDENGNRNTTSLPGVLLPISEKLAVSISDTQSVTQQTLKKAIKTKKEDSANNVKKKVFAKNEGCFIYSLKDSNKSNFEDLFSTTHQLKRNSSTQHFRPTGKGLECTKLPLPLHLCFVSVKSMTL